MSKKTRKEREYVAATRLRNILARHGAATMRTLEQKIADAGPNNQRIDPHIITDVRNALMKAGEISKTNKTAVDWYRLNSAPNDFVAERLALQAPIHQALSARRFGHRVGQALEIAVFRALRAQDGYPFLGNFPDLDAHDDNTLYRKEEPGSISGRSAPGDMQLDFIGIHGKKCSAIEVKNIREWIYPDREEIRDLIAKALAVDAVPVLIARRIHFSTFLVLNRCGIVVHQTYNQRLPATAGEVATQARDKTLLGYHDIREGNEADDRLIKFISSNLPNAIESSVERYRAYKDLLAAYGSGEMPYAEFAARSRRRDRGEDEDGEFPQPDPDEYR